MIKDISALCVLVKMHVIRPMSSQQIVQFLDQSADGRNELDETFRNQHDTECVALRCTMSHNIELKIGKGAQLARSAGSAVQLMAKENDYALLRLPSGELRKVHINCRATIGQVGNLEHENITIGKAGRNRWLGKRPENRGVAMNPNDHPHGGGEGRSPVGRKHPVTKWGKCAMGAKTRRKKASDKLIVRGRK